MLKITGLLLCANMFISTPIPAQENMPAPECTPPPPRFDLALTLHSCKAQADGGTLCAYPAPRASMSGMSWVFTDCAVLLRRAQCHAHWEPWLFVCDTAKQRKGETL